VKKLNQPLAPPPKKCACGKPVDILEIEVLEQSTQKILRGPFGLFGSEVGRNKALVLRPSFAFKRWVPQCWGCYQSAPQQEELLA